MEQADIDFTLSEDAKQKLIDYCLENRISIKETGGKSDSKFIHAPISLHPSPFDKEAFDKVVSLQPQMNKMTVNLMNNMPKVHELLSDLASKDEFTGNIVRISKEVAESGYTQKGYLGINRFDYMFDEETQQPKMIEFNTTASSFGALSYKVNTMHVEQLVEQNAKPEVIERVKRNKNAAEYIIDAIKDAYNTYFGLEKSESNPELGVVLTVLDREERNINDIGIALDLLTSKHQIVNIFVDFDEIEENSKLSDTGVLTYKDKEVAVIYYRTGYDPTNYPKESDWDTRLTLEKSSAIKCPSADHQLLTVKKVQQELNNIEIWKEFNGTDLDDIREFFTGMYGLQVLNEETKAKIEDAKVNYDKYVLKTQREGGGHNYFGDSIPKQLENEDELWKYSLMERIFPVTFPANLLRNGVLWSGQAVSELGIFGTLVVKYGESGQEVVTSEESGCMMRTKPKGTDEGGVNAGYAYVDSPYLVDRGYFSK